MEQAVEGALLRRRQALKAEVLNNHRDAENQDQRTGDQALDLLGGHFSDQVANRPTQEQASQEQEDAADEKQIGGAITHGTHSQLEGHTRRMPGMARLSELTLHLIGKKSRGIKKLHIT